ncbi:MAG: 2-amino-thiazoline-4-carboxylic acid hydrolase [Alphaproteobacteria bacterium]|nr:2-amino-thiazoline-4-carboxylic acid hydrolase [Alphaproteobacteria bacterium]
MGSGGRLGRLPRQVSVDASAGTGPSEHDLFRSNSRGSAANCPSPLSEAAMTDSASPVSLLDEVKLQAKVLVPVLRALRAEIGAERANRFVGDALRDWSKRLYHEIGERAGGSAREKFDAIWADVRPRIGDAVERDHLRKDAEVWDYNITSCRYADFFKALGEPELGTLLTCDIDVHIADVGGAEVEFTRTQTIMQGAPYCDFRYRMKTGAK